MRVIVGQHVGSSHLATNGDGPTKDCSDDDAVVYILPCLNYRPEDISRICRSSRAAEGHGSKGLFNVPTSVGCGEWRANVEDDDAAYSAGAAEAEAKQIWPTPARPGGQKGNNKTF